MLDHAEFTGALFARIATTSVLDTIDHPQLFAPWFRKPSTWAGWRVFLAVLFGLPLGNGDLDLFRQCTGLDAPVRFEELNSFTTFANREIAAESDPLSK